MGRRFAWTTLLLCWFLPGLFGQVVPDSSRAQTNPALLAFSRRSIFELSLQADTLAYTNAFPLGQVFQQTWTIDLDDVAGRLRRRDLRVGASATAGSHLALHFRRASAGVYAAARSTNELVIPYALIQLLAEGNVEDRSGSGKAVIRSGLEYGASVTADYGEWTFGMNLAQYMPIMHSGDGGFSFDVVTTDAGFSADALVDVRVLSGIDLSLHGDGSGLDPAPGFSNAALKADVGVVRRDAFDRPIWGVSLTDLTVVRARTPYEYRLTGSYGASVEHALQALVDDADTDPLTLVAEEPELTFVGESDARIALAAGLAGFYRFSVPYVDIIPHAHIVFDSLLGAFNPGLTVVGNRFPTNMVYVGYGRRRPVWRAVVGLRLPLRPIELSLELAGASPRLFGPFAPDGLSAAVEARLGL